MRKLVKGGSSNERAFELQENFMNHRKHSHTSGTIPLIVAAYLFLWGFQFPAWAGDATRVEPLALRKIMQELGRNMQAITGAISQEEWVQVVQLAPKVAAHPEPPFTEKMRILAYLGADATIPDLKLRFHLDDCSRRRTNKLNVILAVIGVSEGHLFHRKTRWYGEVVPVFRTGNPGTHGSP